MAAAGAKGPPRDCSSLVFREDVVGLLIKAEEATSRKIRGATGRLLSRFFEQVLPQGSAESPVPDYHEVLRLLLPQVRLQRAANRLPPHAHRTLRDGDKAQ